MNFLTLTTNKIKLEIVQKSQIHVVHELLSFPEIDQYNVLGIPKDIDVSATYVKEWIENFHKEKEYVFMIKDIRSHTPIGLIALVIGDEKYKIGSVWYKLFPDSWGKGFATAAASEILKFGFEYCNLHRIEAGCAVENIGSYRVMKKIGMIKEGVKRKALPLQTGWSDTYEYGILKDDWHKLK